MSVVVPIPGQGGLSLDMYGLPGCEGEPTAVGKLAHRTCGTAKT
jgi:hypothetical protein